MLVVDAHYRCRGPADSRLAADLGASGDAAMPARFLAIDPDFFLDLTCWRWRYAQGGNRNFQLKTAYGTLGIRG